MRIEGTYTFPAPIEQVVSTVTHPDLLSQIIPGCERLIQFGPAPDGQPSVFEVRLRRGPGSDVYTMTLTLDTAHSPAHLRADLDGRGPDGPFSGHGQVDFTQQDGQTLATSVWEVKSPVLAGAPDERQAAWDDSAGQFASAFRDRAIGVMRGAAAVSAHSDGVRRLTTPRGRVVVLPRSKALLSSEQARRVLWLGGGLLAGLAAIGVVVAVVRRVLRATGAAESGGSSEG